jgi:hypothetical protein
MESAYHVIVNEKYRVEIYIFKMVTKITYIYIYIYIYKHTHTHTHTIAVKSG